MHSKDVAHIWSINSSSTYCFYYALQASTDQDFKTW